MQVSFLPTFITVTFLLLAEVCDLWSIHYVRWYLGLAKPAAASLIGRWSPYPTLTTHAHPMYPPASNTSGLAESLRRGTTAYHNSVSTLPRPPAPPLSPATPEQPLILAQYVLLWSRKTHISSALTQLFKPSYQAPKTDRSFPQSCMTVDRHHVSSFSERQR